MGEVEGSKNQSGHTPLPLTLKVIYYKSVRINNKYFHRKMETILGWEGHRTWKMMDIPRSKNERGRSMNEGFISSKWSQKGVGKLEIGFACPKMINFSSFQFAIGQCVFMFWFKLSELGDNFNKFLQNCCGFITKTLLPYLFEIFPNWEWQRVHAQIRNLLQKFRMSYPQDVWIHSIIINHYHVCQTRIGPSSSSERSEQRARSASLICKCNYLIIFALLYALYMFLPL